MASKLTNTELTVGSVWADKLNSNPVTDSANPTLSVDGATSIIGALNSMQTSLDGKANSTHTHSIADVNDLSGKLAKLDGIPEGSGKPAYDSESAALSLPYTALADGWIRIKIQNSMLVPFRICIADKPVAGVDVTRKADYSDFYEYSVVPIAKGQVLTSTISVGTAINGRLPFECFFCQG